MRHHLKTMPAQDESIFTRLPNELIFELLVKLPQRDLATLCRTSRLISGLAIAELYHTISLSTAAVLEKFLSSLYADSRSQYVREFSIDFPLSSKNPTLINDAAVALCHFHNLRSLTLKLVDLQLLDLLHDKYFPSLCVFRYYTGRDLPLSLAGFINRHPKITILDLFRGDSSDFHLEPIHLPNLTKYTGSGSFVQSMVCENKMIKTLCVYPPCDDVGTVLAALSDMVSQNSLGFMMVSDELREASIFACLAVTMPQVRFVSLQTVLTAANPISEEHVADIAKSLRYLLDLVILEISDDMFRDVEDWETDISDLETDRSIVQCWSAACASLNAIKLHGKRWELDLKHETGWHVKG
ncbi:hypothetical protein C8R47DRAFT_48513 [Mycena vitilis]|nr:hypothetical protein C8R47DRAFT_48513 [Mycena vitilis]